MAKEKKLTLYVGRYETKTMAFSSAEKHLRVLRGAGKKVKPKKWQLETCARTPNAKRIISEWKILGERIKAALNI